ncbi:hypothetical protein [Sulfitobacter sp. R18_1]|uniref:hypothetical protein n=1 Tax=Sulfitobacter sp. R18_1 TaxID=2821104 RepID=UPI001ADA771F|nr:hypothetical protein [Sulfitobacter sp. R18_1]MBO9428208.1 hypothetical protein [Sulfitobacter sp. R18_1]
MSLTNRKVPPILLQLIKVSEGGISVDLGLDDYDLVTYSVSLPGKYGTLKITDGSNGLHGTSRYDTEFDINSLEDIYDVALESVSHAQSRSGHTDSDPIEWLGDGWIKVGMELGYIKSETKTVTTYRMAR